MLLIINADDLGLCYNCNAGIFQSFQDGLVTSASLLVNTSTAQEAAAKAKEHGLPLGLHFNISEGQSVSNSEDIEPILQPNTKSSHGFYQSMFLPGELLFKGRDALYILLDEGSHDTLEAVRKELRSQIERFITLVGSPPIHVDGHQHAHIMGLAASAFAEVLSEYGIKKARIPYEELKNCPWIGDERRALLERITYNAQQARGVFENFGIYSTTYYTGLTTMGRDGICSRIIENLSNLDKKLSAPYNSSVEWMVHPGIPDISWDDFNCSAERQLELELLTNSTLVDYIRESNFQLGTYTDI